jgi:phosphoribosyl 1,2-cyclic phosphodiesterase
MNSNQENKITLISFGSGSSGNCYWLSTKEGTIMIDAGVGIRTLKRRMKEFGVSLEGVSALFVTHDHTDHIKAIGSIGEKYKVPVYATETVQDSPRMLRSYHLRRELRSSARTLLKEQPVEVGPFRVTAFEVPHDGLDNVGYQVEVAGQIFCFVTDIGEITPLAAGYMNRANYLILESNYDEAMLRTGSYPEELKKRIAGPRGHLCNRDTAEFIASRVGGPLKHVWLCHLSDDNNRPEIALQTVERALQVYGYQRGVEVEVDALKRQVAMKFEIDLNAE